MPELALLSSQTDDYQKYHHRIFAKQEMEIESETLIRALDLAPKVLLKSKRRENMSKDVKIMRSSPT